MGPGLVLLAGLPGAGKSTLAAALAERLPRARLLDRDRVRHALFQPAEYSREESDASFDAVLVGSRFHLAQGRIVILDGLTFSRASAVVRARALAVEAGAWSAAIRCEVPVEVAAARCEADRSARRHPAADRDADLVGRVAVRFDEPQGRWLRLDTTQSPAVSAEQAAAWVRASYLAWAGSTLRGSRATDTAQVGTSPRRRGDK